MTSPLRGKVQTVLGSIDPERLGVTLPHDHLLIDTGFSFHEPKCADDRHRANEPVGLENHYEISYNLLQNRDNMRVLDESVAMSEAQLFRMAGGEAMVDPTNVGLGRDPLALARISRATGLHIVMGSGYYAASSHPPDMDTRSEDSITREIIADITVGVADTGVRSGIVGEIGCSWPWTANEQKVLRAAAEAAKVTGAVLTIHPGRDAAAPQIHLKMIRQTGLGFDRVVMCHVERTVDTADGLKELAETGCYLEYDLFGIEISHYPMSAFELPSDAERMRQIMGLIDGGYLERVLISHDIAFKVRLVRYGGHGYAHILRHIVPRLRKRGLGDKEIRTLLVDNPARAITIA